MSLLAEIASSFTLGILTPLTAACVLPLYPGFLSYLSNQFSGEENRWVYALSGLLASLGVLAFMGIVGLLFTTILQQSLTGVVEVASPIAFGIMGIISIFLIIDVDMSNIVPKTATPNPENPLLNAFIFGFFFGAIVIPCNPGFVAVFFTRAFLIESFVSSMLNFLAFGFGIGFPLLAFSLVSSRWSQTIIGFTTSHKTAINRTAGIIMLVIALYYLSCVFGVLGIGSLPLIEPACGTLSDSFTQVSNALS